MATVLDRVPVARISEEAADVHPGRALLTIIAAVFYVVGWVAAKVVGAVAWSAAAVKVGWQEARTTRPAAGGDD
jgi:hypothetical protein